MGRNNKELHEALENLDGTEFTIGSTIAKTLKNFNSGHIISVTTFTLGTAESTVVVKNSTGATVTAEQDGTYKLHEEIYSVINSKAGYFSKTTSITVTQANITAGIKAVTLDALVKYCVATFTAADSVTSDALTDFTVVVKLDGEVVTAESNGTYKLVADTYAYDISKAGYTAQTAVELVVSAGDVSGGTKTVNTLLVAVVG